MPSVEKYESFGDNLRPIVLEAGWYYPGMLRKKSPSSVPEIQDPLPERKRGLEILHKAARNRRSGRRTSTASSRREKYPE